jgi:hypothetical protein
MIFTNSEKRYASLIHALTCNSNHTDACGWFAGEEYRETYFYTHAQRELDKFKQTHITLDQLEAFVLMRHPSREDWIIK